jgi:hypothetical protein
MSSTFSQASADLVSVSKEPECEQSRSVKSSRSAAPSSKSIGRMSPAMKTLQPSPLIAFEQMELLPRSSAEASPAKIYRPLGQGPALKVSEAAYGQNTPDLLANYDPATSSWRTSQGCFLTEWAEFSETWPRLGMTRSGTAYRHQRSAHHTSARGSGLLPTPRKGCAIEFSFPAKAMAKAVRKGSSVFGPCSVLAELGVDRRRILVAYTRLMGFPPGWTKLQPSATPSSRKSLERDTLYITDAEMIRRMGVPEKIARDAIRALDATENKYGLPARREVLESQYAVCQ